jgi:hypothetical protein
MKRYSKFFFIVGLTTFLALLGVMFYINARFPNEGLAQTNPLVILAESLLVLFLVNSTFLWINGVRILKERWSVTGEYQKLFLFWAMVAVAPFIGYVLWLLERRQENEPNV